MLGKPEVVANYSMGFYRSLIWALIHPSDAEEQLKRNVDETASGAVELTKLGMEFEGDFPPSVTEWITVVKDIIATFEEFNGDLPAIEPSLLAISEFAARIEP